MRIYEYSIHSLAQPFNELDRPSGHRLTKDAYQYRSWSECIPHPNVDSSAIKLQASRSISSACPKVPTKSPHDANPRRYILDPLSTSSTAWSPSAQPQPPQLSVSSPAYYPTTIPLNSPNNSLLGLIPNSPTFEIITFHSQRVVLQFLSDHRWIYRW